MAGDRYRVLRSFPAPGNPATHMVADAGTKRFLGAVGANYYRPWVFPLYTPSHLTVIREFPFDHPFHNGIFVGQHPVVLGGREANFWATPPRRSPNDPIFRDIGRMDFPDSPAVEPHESGVKLTLRGVWRDEDGQPVLDEVRTVDFRAMDDATVCDVTSAKTASHGALEFPKTKFGSIGIRVEPRLLPSLGGVIHGDGGRRGDASVVTQTDSDFVAYEGGAPGGGRFGVCLRILDNSASDDRRGTWFIRDYGMAMFNPTWTRPISLPEGETWTVGLRVVAYDGAFTCDRAQAWREEIECAGRPLGDD